MKTKILASLVLGSILFSSSASANAITAASDYIAEHPDKVAKAKEALKFGFKHAKSIPKRAAVVVAGKTAKTVVEHPLLTATGIAAYAWYSATSVDNAVYQIARQPEALDNYLEQNPTKINEFVSKAIDKYYDNEGKSDQVLYENLLDKIGIIDIDKDYNYNDMYKTRSDQDALENTADFITEYSDLEKQADSYDKKNKNICTFDIAKKMVVKTGAKFYDETQSINIPTLNNNLPEKYNIDQYWKLKSKIYTLENDHIPSYEALKLFFLKHDKNVFIDKNGNELPKINNGKRYAYLNNNASSITIEYNLHRNNRTTGYRNIFYSVIDSIDSKHLRIATFKDYATLLVLSKNNVQEYTKLKLAFITLYSRNKMLCIYDI